jgi:aryl-alcohol dehydrogenase-like predicted oxidoreductase
MQYRQLGRSGLVVSRLSFGAMTFGDHDFHGFRSVVGQELADRMVARALDAGVNVFDTANMYAAGQSEEILGRALGPRRRDVVLVTKAFFRTAPEVVHGGLSRRHLIDACEASLRRLGTDFIDLYLLHNVDRLVPLEETARALDDLQRAGKIRYAGISNYHAWQAEALLRVQSELGCALVVANQVYHSLLGRDIEECVVPQSVRAGVGLMAWGPLAGGYLTGKYRDDGDSGARRETFDFPPIDTEVGDSVVGLLRKIAQGRGVTPAEVAMAWELSHEWLDTLLVGATRMEQLEANLGAAALDLTADEVSRLSERTQIPARYPAWIQRGEEGSERAIGEGWTPSTGGP